MSCWNPGTTNFLIACHYNAVQPQQTLHILFDIRANISAGNIRLPLQVLIPVSTMFVKVNSELEGGRASFLKFNLAWFVEIWKLLLQSTSMQDL